MGVVVGTDWFKSERVAAVYSMLYHVFLDFLISNISSATVCRQIRYGLTYL